MEPRPGYRQTGTVIGWHRAGFRLFWRLRSKPKTPSRPKLDAEVRALIRRMVKENSTWGSPRIHGELLKLGFNVSERTVSRCTQTCFLTGVPDSSAITPFGNSSIPSARIPGQ
jgi:Homeodomain-like domain